MPIVRVSLPVPLPQLFDYTSEDATLGDVGRCVRVPFGRGEKSGVIVGLPVASEVDPSRLKPVRHIQREVASLPADWLELVGFAAHYYHAPLGEVIALALPPGLRRADAVSDRDADPLLALTHDGREALEAGRRASRALSLLREMDAAGVVRRSVARVLPSGESVGDALRRGWIAAVKASDPAACNADGLPALTAEQREAVDAIAGAPPGFVPWLLHGVTGSGKTEVYLRLAARALQAGRQVLMLVPEIALTPQLESRVAGRFQFPEA